MKRIEYRGGILSFNIPDSWIAEFEDDGGGIFYEDGPGPDILRLNVLTFRSPSEESIASVVRAFEKMECPEPAPIQITENGLVFRAYASRGEEDGEPITTYYWELGQPVLPNHMRLAIFSYTVPTSHASEPSLMALINVLNREIRDATFAASLGNLSD